MLQKRITNKLLDGLRAEGGRVSSAGSEGSVRGGDRAGTSGRDPAPRRGGRNSMAKDDRRASADLFNVRRASGEGQRTVTGTGVGAETPPQGSMGTGRLSQNGNGGASSLREPSMGRRGSAQSVRATSRVGSEMDGRLRRSSMTLEDQQAARLDRRLHEILSNPTSLPRYKDTLPLVKALDFLEPDPLQPNRRYHEEPCLSAHHGDTSSYVTRAEAAAKVFRAQLAPRRSDPGTWDTSFPWPRPSPEDLRLTMAVEDADGFLKTRTVSSNVLLRTGTAKSSKSNISEGGDREKPRSKTSADQPIWEPGLTIEERKRRAPVLGPDAALMSYLPTGRRPLALVFSGRAVLHGSTMQSKGPMPWKLNDEFIKQLTDRLAAAAAQAALAGASVPYMGQPVQSGPGHAPAALASTYSQMGTEGIGSPAMPREGIFAKAKRRLSNLAAGPVPSDLLNAASGMPGSQYASEAAFKSMDLSKGSPRMNNDATGTGGAPPTLAAALAAGAGAAAARSHLTILAPGAGAKAVAMRLADHRGGAAMHQSFSSADVAGQATASADGQARDHHGHDRGVRFNEANSMVDGHPSEGPSSDAAPRPKPAATVSFMASLAAARAAGVQATPVRGKDPHFMTQVQSSGGSPASHENPAVSAKGSEASAGTQKRGGMRRLSLMNNTQITAAIQAASMGQDIAAEGVDKPMASMNGRPSNFNDAMAAAAAAAASVAQEQHEEKKEGIFARGMRRLSVARSGASASASVAAAAASAAAANASHHGEEKKEGIISRGLRRLSVTQAAALGSPANLSAQASHASGLGDADPSVEASAVSGTRKNRRMSALGFLTGGAAGAAGQPAQPAPPGGAPTGGRFRRMSALLGGQGGQNKHPSSLEGALAAQLGAQLDRVRQIEALFKGVQDMWKKELVSWDHVPLRLADFKNLVLISRGQRNCKVYSAVHTFGNLRSMTVLKTFDVMRMDDNEVKALGRYAEVCIRSTVVAGAVRFRGCFIDGNFFFFMFEHCTRGDMMRLAMRQGGSLPEPDVAIALFHVLHYLRKMHRNGLIHRDLKPENILITSAGDHRLAGLGNAICADRERPKTPVGTIDFMSPEMLRAIPEAKPARARRSMRRTGEVMTNAFFTPVTHVDEMETVLEAGDEDSRAPTSQGVRNNSHAIAALPGHLNLTPADAGAAPRESRSSLTNWIHGKVHRTSATNLEIAGGHGQAHPKGRADRNSATNVELNGDGHAAPPPPSDRHPRVTSQVSGVSHGSIGLGGGPKRESAKRESVTDNPEKDKAGGVQRTRARFLGKPPSDTQPLLGPSGPGAAGGPILSTAGGIVSTSGADRGPAKGAEPIGISAPSRFQRFGTIFRAGGKAGGAEGGAAAADDGAGKRLFGLFGRRRDDRREALADLGAVDRYDEKTDIWSLGVATFELLCGHTPFEVDDPQLTQALILFGEIDTWPTVLSIEARDFLTRCLRKNPDERPGAGELLLHPLIVKHVLDEQGNFKKADAITRDIEKTRGFEAMKRAQRRYLQKQGGLLDDPTKRTFLEAFFGCLRAPRVRPMGAGGYSGGQSTMLSRKSSIFPAAGKSGMSTYIKDPLKDKVGRGKSEKELATKAGAGTVKEAPPAAVAPSGMRRSLDIAAQMGGVPATRRSIDMTAGHGIPGTNVVLPGGNQRASQGPSAMHHLPPAPPPQDAFTRRAAPGLVPQRPAPVRSDTKEWSLAQGPVHPAAAPAENGGSDAVQPVLETAGAPALMVGSLISRTAAVPEPLTKALLELPAADSAEPSPLSNALRPAPSAAADLLGGAQRGSSPVHELTMDSRASVGVGSVLNLKPGQPQAAPFLGGLDAEPSELRFSNAGGAAVAAAAQAGKSRFADPHLGVPAPNSKGGLGEEPSEVRLSAAGGRLSNASALSSFALRGSVPVASAVAPGVPPRLRADLAADGVAAPAQTLEIQLSYMAPEGEQLVLGGQA